MRKLHFLSVLLVNPKSGLYTRLRHTVGGWEENIAQTWNGTFLLIFYWNAFFFHLETRALLLMPVDSLRKLVIIDIFCAQEKQGVILKASVCVYHSKQSETDDAWAAFNNIPEKQVRFYGKVISSMLLNFTYKKVCANGECTINTRNAFSYIVLFAQIYMKLVWRRMRLCMKWLR